MMLLEFTLRNYGPFRDEAVLSMEKDAGDEHPDNTVICPETGKQVLTSAAVFGLVFFAEIPSPLMLAGMVMAIASISIMCKPSKGTAGTEPA